MAHDNNGHIYAQQSNGSNLINDIKAVVGVNAQDDPFASSVINKWSKHKPIKFPGMDRLSEDEFRGTDTQISAGYVYGVKIAGTNQKILPSLHTEITEAYLRPDGIIPTEPYRLLDFDGYRHNAQPSPLISYPWRPGETMLVYKDLEEGLPVTVAYGGEDAGGIDIISAMGVSPSSIYLCGMISRGSLCLVAALQNNEEGEVTPVFYHNAWQRSFRADFRTIQSQLPVDDDYTFSCFFVASSQNPESMPLDGTWNEIPNLGYANRPWDAPNGMNRALEIQQYNILPPEFYVKSSSTEFQDNLQITVAYNPVVSDRIGVYEVELQYGSGGNHVFRPLSTQPNTFVPDASTEVLRQRQVSVPWTEFELPGRPSSGTIHIIMRTKWTDSGEWKVTNEDDITIQ